MEISIATKRKQKGENKIKQNKQTNRKKSQNKGDTGSCNVKDGNKN